MENPLLTCVIPEVFRESGRWGRGSGGGGWCMMEGRARDLGESPGNMCHSRCISQQCKAGHRGSGGGGCCMMEGRARYHGESPVMCVILEVFRDSGRRGRGSRRGGFCMMEGRARYHGQSPGNVCHFGRRRLVYDGG